MRLFSGGEALIPIQHSTGRAKHVKPKRAFFSNKRNLVIFGISLLVVGTVGWLGFRILQVKNDLTASQDDVMKWVDAAKNNRFDLLPQISEELEARSSGAVSASSDPVWKLAELVPVVGPNLSAVHSTSEAISVLSKEAITPTSELLASGITKNLMKPEGGLNLEAIDSLAELTTQLGQSLDHASGLISHVDSASLMAPVGEPIAKLQSYLNKAQPLAAQASTIMTVLPSFLGAEGQRNYLLLFMNNAEVNTLGGDSAQRAILTINNGKIELGETTSSTDLKDMPDEFQMPDSAVDVFGSLIEKDMNLATSRPDFPSVGDFSKRVYEHYFGQQIDGVIALDPVMLGYLLRATGPITLSTGDELNANNVASLLLHDIYLRYPDETGPQTDAFFTEAVSVIFDKFKSFSGSPLELVKALQQGTSENRLLLWSSNEAEQKVFSALPIAGTLPATNESSTTLGVYMRDFSASKMDFFLKSSVKAEVVECDSGKIKKVSVTTTLENTVPSVDFAAGLPKYVLSEVLPEGQFRTGLYSFGPVGASIDSSVMELSGVDNQYQGSKSDLNRPVSIWLATLAPTEKAIMTTVFTLQDSQTGPLKVQVTPNLNPTKVEIVPSQCSK